MILSHRTTLLLLVLQLDSAFFLWSTALLTNLSQNVFVLFLVVDLVGFAMISYTYRKERSNETPGRVWMGIGCFLLAGLLFSALLYA